MILKLNKKNYVDQSFNNTTKMVDDLIDVIKILLLDIYLPDGNGNTACKELVRRFSNLKIITLTNYKDVPFIKLIIKNSAGLVRVVFEKGFII